MKKIYLSIATILVSISLNAQITLENTYNGLTYYASCKMINLNSGDKYVFYDATINQLKLYNTNHSLWKTISIPTIPNYTFHYYENISENLFNTNEQVECLITYYNPTDYNQHTALINENGSIAFIKLNSYFDGIKVTENNSYKLLLSDALNNDKYVYSLPGTSSNLGISNDEKTLNIGHSYPNPANQFITLPYEIKVKNTIGLVTIYDASGKVVESFKVDDTFNNIILDLSSYSAGTYHYNLIVNGIESNAKTFIKNE